MASSRSEGSWASAPASFNESFVESRKPGPHKPDQLGVVGDGKTTQVGGVGISLAECLPTRVGLFQVEATIMQPTYSSGTTSSMRLQALIADLQWKIQLFNSDIADEEQRTGL
jgi:hypothetical protein